MTSYPSAPFLGMNDGRCLSIMASKNSKKGFVISEKKYSFYNETYEQEKVTKAIKSVMIIP
jgi:hypothetical protein